MAWFRWFRSKPTQVDDFVKFFLRPLTDMLTDLGVMSQEQQQLTQLFAKGYDLSADSQPHCEKILTRLTRSLKKRRIPIFARQQIQSAEARFFRDADERLVPAEKKQIEAWFRGLEHRYCSPADKLARSAVDQWKQACQAIGKSAIDESRMEEPAENPSVSKSHSSESSSEPLPTQVDSENQAIETEMTEPVEEHSAELSPASVNAALRSEAEPASKGSISSAASNEVPKVESKFPDGESPEPTYSGSQPNFVESRVESSPIKFIDVTGEDDALWKEVEGEHAKAIVAWNDLVAVKKTLASFESFISKAELPGLLFDQFRNFDSQNMVFEVDATKVEREIWFLGDVHSDLLALESALVYIRRRGNPFAIVLLGDLFDDGPLGAETVLRVMRLILDDPSFVTLIVGNHDEALEISTDGTKFLATVSPCEFSEWLNAPDQQSNPLARKLGELTVELVSRCPRALFFKDGLIAAHGGVPLPDVWDSLASVRDLNQPNCLQDFVWTRPHHRRKRTIPNRSKKGAGLGYEDFDDFCERAGNLFGFPVRWMIRGHDHVDTVERFASFDAYESHPMLTINTLCYRLYRENLGEHVRAPCIAKHVPGELPEIHCLRIPEALVSRVYPAFGG